MRLRRLNEKDAKYMLEWMHDESVVKDLQADFLSKTIDDCKNFIKDSLTSDHNAHYAIVDEKDEYMGTVSLKNISSNYAEFGITVRTKAMGKGYSKYAMNEIIRIAFEEKGLNTVYWCVSPKNERAVRFYDKNGYNKTDASLLPIGDNYTSKQINYYIWYRVDMKRP